MNEVADEKRFGKTVALALNELRHGTHDGLFTAFNEEHNWQLAHRILVPAFGPLSIKSMFPEMHDIASQLVLKWARHGSDHIISVTDDFTRLTLDTLALCAMDYRFNSFYSEHMHPFVDCMVRFLVEGGNRTRRPALMSAFFRREDATFFADIEYMRKLSDELVQNRKKHPKDTRDLLNAMINGRDPKTGERLSDASIIDNMITFLIAGHETTSGLLSFAFYYLLKSPNAYQKAQQEVDQVIGKGPAKVEHLTKLPYITAILRETLRLQPTAPAFVLQCHAETEIIGGKYLVEKNQPIVALLPKMHQDPAVYGEDAAEWKPERMLDENFAKIPPNAWKPFGNGMRGCIGRPFAWQEALLVTAMLLQHFDFSMADPTYQLQWKQSLTIKPKDFNMRASLRNNVTPITLEHSLTSSASGDPRPQQDIKLNPIRPVASTSPQGKPMSIYYGSNTGTCEAFAQRLAADAASHGFSALKVDTLDSMKQNLPQDQPIAIITASYEGAPCDNAAHFVSWLENVKEGERLKASYAVFGAGHSDWKATFHRVPIAIDDILAAHGADRICNRGTADAARGDMFSDFESWEDQVFWPAMTKKYSSTLQQTGTESAYTEQGLDVTVSSPRKSTLRQDVSEARVVATQTLTAPDVPPKRHIEIELPSDMTYTAGDYLAILPLNPAESVLRVMRRFGLAWDSMLTISAQNGTTLPTEIPISAFNLFGAYVELSQPTTKRGITTLADACKDGATKSELTKLAGDTFADEISKKRVSLLDLLDRYPDIELPLGSFIASLPPMRVRQYSISCSPLWNPKHVTLTYAVLNQPSLSGRGQYVGVASNHLCKLEKGDKLHVAVKKSNQAFHLPSDPENVPVIMAAAGTGLAPFRGFIQERAAQIGAGRTLAPAVLFLGCRDPDKDELYRAELDKWEKMGAVDIKRAYSRKRHKYVQDALWANRSQVMDLWDRGAHVFVCGSRELGEAIRAVSLRMYRERAEERGKDSNDETAEKWFDGIRNDRYATDVFA
ncbi:hypothetical protein LTR66_002023 [Elasticomyces elasticus]|nr:hypothetical protein LTR66_002023 [Elasticomyces elasticus]